MTRALTFSGIFAATLLVGCGSEQTIGVVDASIVVSPSLTDLKEVPVGEVISFDIQVDHDQGVPVEILSVTAINIEGDYFTYDGDGGKQLIERSGTLILPFSYAPTETGYHRATIEIASNAREQTVEVQSRGHAVLPEATVWPLGVDFGPVEFGEVKQKSITIANQSDLDLTLSDAAFSFEVFSLVSPAVPFTVAAENEQVVTLAFTPTDTNPATGNLTLRAGSVELPQVSLRGNDCENGDPAAYDEDGDGYTTCGGDCNDDDIDVRPGALEIADAVDNDCDGDVDEDTPWADDDGDGFCDDDVYCSDGSTPGDCSDSSDLAANTDQVYPGQVEDMTNGIDDDCDGVVDQGTTDADGDGYSVDGGDCDDSNADAFPGNAESPDFVDNDCDLIIDETTVFYDDDGDGFCDDAVTCSDGSTPGDCDDDVTDSYPADGQPDGRPTSPLASEQPDWRDNDCDGIVDEGTVNYDDDGDGYTETGGDCDDNDPAESPAITGNVC